MKTIAIANHKGGTGKTATAHNLGAVLAEFGRRVLLIDTDPQGSLTQAVRPGDYSGASLAEVIGGANPGSLQLPEVVKQVNGGLDLIPSDLELSACELGLVTRLGRENVLKRALLKVAGLYDVCLIDCPPSLGLLTVAALVAADAVMIPTQPQAVDLRGLSLFLRTLANIQELNPTLENLGILITFYDGRLNHHKAALEAIQDAGLPLLRAKVGRSVKVAEAAAAGLPVTEYEPSNPQTANYQELGKEVNQWLTNNQG